MNIIDTKRLAKDRAYWDKVAPEGATHYDPEDMGAPWMRELESNWMFYWESKRGWVRYLQKAILARIVARLVIRPDAQEEWTGTGLPPVGTECEVVIGAQKPRTVCFVGIKSSGSVVIENVDGEFASYHRSQVIFRPIRTQAQRERDDLLTSIIEDYRKSFDRPMSTIEEEVTSEFSNYLYDAGMLRRAGN